MRRLRRLEPTWENVSYSELRCAAYAELLGDKSIAEPWIVNSQVASVGLGTWQIAKLQGSLGRLGSWVWTTIGKGWNFLPTSRDFTTLCTVEGDFLLCFSQVLGLCRCIYIYVQLIYLRNIFYVYIQYVYTTGRWCKDAAHDFPSYGRDAVSPRGWGFAAMDLCTQWCSSHTPLSWCASLFRFLDSLLECMYGLV